MKTEEECKTYLKSIDKEFSTGGIGCNGVFDEILCWEATPANASISQKCPELDGMFDSSSIFANKSFFLSLCNFVHIFRNCL
jgi:hypothetical protein